MAVPLCVGKKHFLDVAMGKGAKRRPTSFSSATSANVWISPQIFLIFIFNPFAHIGIKFQVSPKLSNLSQAHPSKKAVFLVKYLQDRGCDNLS